MTIQVRGVTVAVSVTAGGALAVPNNTLIQSGDLMLAWFSCPSGVPREQSVMDGWHQYGKLRAYDSTYLFLYYRYSGGSEPSSYDTDFSANMSGAMVVLYEDSSGHLNIDAVARDIRSASTSIVYPAVTASAAGWLLNLGCVDGTASQTAAGGSTEEVDGPASTVGRIYLMHSVVSGAGSTGTKTNTASASVSSELLSMVITDAAGTYPTGPVFRSSRAKGQQNSVTSYTIDAPPNLAAGDYVVLELAFQSSSPSPITVTDGGGATWTLIDEITGNNSIHVYAKVATVGDVGATYTVSWSGTENADAVISAYYAPSGNSINLDLHTNQTNTSVSGIVFPSVTPSANNSLVLWMNTSNSSTNATWDTSATYGQPHSSTGTNFRLRLFSEHVSVAGATGTRTATGPGSNNNNSVVLVLNEQLIPSDPSGLSATKNGTSQIDLAWSDTANNETGYEIEESSDGSTGWSLIHTTAANVTSYSVTGLAEDTTKYYRVRAINDDGASDYTDVASATTDLAAPTSLTATAVSQSQIDLAWTDNSSVETGYEVEQSANGTTGWSNITTTAANATSFSVTGLTEATTYYFRVRAAKSAVHSTYTSVANDITFPAAPTGLTATAQSTTEIQLLWTDNAASEDGYQIWHSTDGSSFSLLDTLLTSNTSYNHTGLSEATRHYYKVRSYKGSDYSAYTNTADTYTKPATPTIGAVTANSTTSITVNWTDNSSGEASYYVERSPDGSGSWSVVSSQGADTTSFTDTGLTVDTPYFYRVRCSVGGVYSLYSDTGDGFSNPAPVTGLTVTNLLSTKQRLTWTNPNVHFTNFQVYQDGSQIGTTTSTSYDVTGLTANTAYTYKIRVNYGGSLSAFTSDVVETTYHALIAPYFLSTISNGTGVLLTWGILDEGVSGYSLERSTDGVSFTEIATPSVTHYNDNSVTPTVTYIYRVRSYRSGSIEYSPYSILASIVVPITPRSVKPQHLFILSPAVVYTASVNMDSFSYPMDYVGYDTGSGILEDIKIGMTIRFGSVPGGDDWGVARIVAAPTDTVFAISRSSQGRRIGEVDLHNDAYITVVDEYRVWTKTPYFAADGTIFKDTNIAISDNTSKPPPVSNCGPGVADYYSTVGGSMRVTFQSTSYATAAGATISSYLWDFADGDVLSGTVTDDGPIVVDFPIGFRWIHLTVTDSNGKSHTSHAPIFADDPDDSQAIDHFEIAEHTIKQDGQSISFKIYDSLYEYPEGALVMLWEGDREDSADRTSMKFIGWHYKDPTELTANRTANLSETRLDCLDIAGMMGLIPGYSQVLENTASPTDWTHFKEPNLDLYIHYLLHWHSTVLEMADFQWSGTGSTYAFQVGGSDASNLLEQVQQRCQTFQPDKILTCNRRGQLRVLSDPFYLNSVDRTTTEQVSLHPFDYSSVTYTGQGRPRIKRLHGGAIKTGFNETPVTLFSYSPGMTPGQGTEEQEHTEGLAPSQTVLNEVTGHRYARLNASYDKFQVRLAYGDDRDIEPADMTWVRLELPSSISSNKWASFNNRFLVTEISKSYEYNRTGSVITVDLTLELETVGFPGNIDTPLAAASIDLGWSPIASASLGCPPFDIPAATTHILMMNESGIIYKTSNWDNATPTWTANTTLLTDTSVVNLTPNPFYTAIVNAYSPLYTSEGSTIEGYGVNSKGIYKINDMGGTTPSLTLLYSFPQHTYVQFRTINVGNCESAEGGYPKVIGIASAYRDIGHYPSGDWNGTSYIYSLDGGVTWSEEVFVTNKIDVNLHGNEVKTRPALFISSKVDGKVITTGLYQGPDIPSNDPSDGEAYVSTNNGASFSPLPSIATGNNIAGTIHVPWNGNSSEAIIYYGVTQRDSSGVEVYGFYRNTTDITPASGGKSFGPWTFNSGVDTYQGNKLKLVMVGRGNGVDDTNELTQTTEGKQAVFISDDGGDTWTEIIAPMDGRTIDSWPSSAKFASDDSNTVFIWGNDRYVAFTTDFGATIDDKTGNIGSLSGSGHRMVLFTRSV